ncbi:serine O-acetyltransferase [Caulobacter sp. 602-1]|uniref:serine O-acetyltransferase n=1 Tax=Caulobacter sp. 602-1 TaxID=2492472 RepID=UPI000F6314B3|nr:serine acetyltransferase [Caulobacter sp. 602-1]RRN62195.1 serine acetyltransferase [Caulobacter sp. 602-1]
MTPKLAVWRQDLKVNAQRSGWGGALRGWMANPGFAVVCLYRLSARYHGRSWLLSMLFWRSIVKGYGCYLSPSAVIGPGLRLPHPVGVVVGEGAVIGAGVTLYQGVTLGRSNHVSAAYPTLEDDVTVYAGAVLVGDIRIGRGAVVAANAVVLKDVPPYAKAVGAPARMIIDAKSAPTDS